MTGMDDRETVYPIACFRMQDQYGLLRARKPNLAQKSKITQQNQCAMKYVYFFTGVLLTISVGILYKSAH
ncbi:hypothetical protein ASF29_14635 [Rhizobium sp. Leaf262]|nr:hypothetical protein ASF29_14635 [Rhizobium sp. Leaf262]